MTEVIIGSRESKLAVLQSEMVKSYIEQKNREENAGLGLIFMNFADKQEGSGVDYKSDWLIQTIIDNNFKFALRKKGSSTTPSSKYNATYSNGGNAVGWDK